MEHLHEGGLGSAQVLMEAGGRPFLLENAWGEGRVTTLLSGAQGALRRDGGELPGEWFESSTWSRVLASLASRAFDHSFELTDPLPLERVAVPPMDDFDIRFFQIVNRPHPFTLAPGEAYEVAARLRSLGFTSAVFGASSKRPLDDRRAMEEIAAAGLRIVYYDGVRPHSPESRFWRDRPKPPRVDDATGHDLGWDVHSAEFREAAVRLLDGRPPIGDLPLRAVQLVEEFSDESFSAGSRPKGRKTVESDEAWLAKMQSRADASAETLSRFEASGARLFPGLPQSTYWPGSYWARPGDYGYRLSALAASVDEILGPGYGYGSARPEIGPESVRWSANGGWSALRVSGSTRPHLAIYAMGRPLDEKTRFLPDAASWAETAWTAMAHGATGLAYWALPRGDSTSSLSGLHEELARLGPWLAAAPRTPAPVALLASWTSRSVSPDPEVARGLNRCLKNVHMALELGFEDIDIVYEEQLETLSPETRVIVIVGSPVLSVEAEKGLRAFLESGGRLLVERGSALRRGLEGDPLDLGEIGRDRVDVLPDGAGCGATRRSARRASRVLRKALGEIGVKPRFSTQALDTELSQRGEAELIYLTVLNHGRESARIVTRPSLVGFRDRVWTELRSGDRVLAGEEREDGLVRTVAASDAVIWASVERPATELSMRRGLAEDAFAIEISGRDEAGEAVADGYPARIVVGNVMHCGHVMEKSITLREGRATIEWPGCEMEPGDPVAWSITDPLTGRVYSGRLSGKRGRSDSAGSRVDAGLR